MMPIVDLWHEPDDCRGFHNPLAAIVTKGRADLLQPTATNYPLPAPERHPVEHLALGDYPTHGLVGLITRWALTGTLG
jgi:hypothetical protein